MSNCRLTGWLFDRLIVVCVVSSVGRLVCCLYVVLIEGFACGCVWVCLLLLRGCVLVGLSVDDVLCSL